MDVMHSRGKADDEVVIDGDGDVMAGVGEEFAGSIGIDWIVEYLSCCVD
jgi:hypothetical protein